MYIPDHNNPKWPAELVKEWAGGTGHVENPEIVDFVIRRKFGDKYLEAMYLIYGCGWSQADACNKTGISSSLMSRKKKAIIHEFVHTWEWRMLMNSANLSYAIFQMRNVFTVEGHASQLAQIKQGLRPDIL